MGRIGGTFGTALGTQSSIMVPGFHAVPATWERSREPILDKDQVSFRRRVPVRVVLDALASNRHESEPPAAQAHPAVCLAVSSLPQSQEILETGSLQHRGPFKSIHRVS